MRLRSRPFHAEYGRVRRSALRFVVIPLGLTLVAVGVFALAEGGVLAGTLGLLIGLALIGLCVFDAPPNDQPAVLAQTQGTDAMAAESARERAMDRLFAASLVATLGSAAATSVFL